MNQNDHELEALLREFTPRQPRSLPAIPVDLPSRALRWHSQRLAAAVLLTIAGSASVWLASRQTTPASFPAVLATAASSNARTPENTFPSLVLLERLALEDPAQFDATMNAASRRILQHAHYWEPLPHALAKD